MSHPYRTAGLETERCDACGALKVVVDPHPRSFAEIENEVREAERELFDASQNRAPIRVLIAQSVLTRLRHERLEKKIDRLLGLIETPEPVFDENAGAPRARGE